MSSFSVCLIHEPRCISSSGGLVQKFDVFSGVDEEGCPQFSPEDVVLCDGQEPFPVGYFLVRFIFDRNSGTYVPGRLYCIPDSCLEKYLCKPPPSSCLVVVSSFSSGDASPVYKTSVVM